MISGAIKLSAYADQLNISGGMINGNIIGQGSSNTINFGPGAGNTFTYGASYKFTGINQVNVNTGTVILDGAGNMATNLTVANGANLEVGDINDSSATLTVTTFILYGTLSGHGTFIGVLDVEPGGTLSPGGTIGTLTINGNLTLSSGSYYAIEISPTQASKTQFNRIATLNGASVVVTPDTNLGKYAAHTCTILSDTGGGLGGGNTFNPTVTVTRSGLISDPTLTYDADDVYLSVQAYAIRSLCPPTSRTMRGMWPVRSTLSSSAAALCRAASRTSPISPARL